MENYKKKLEEEVKKRKYHPNQKVWPEKDYKTALMLKDLGFSAQCMSNYFRRHGSNYTRSAIIGKMWREKKK